MSALPEKPTRTFSKRMTGACIIAAWATIWLSMWLGVAMATIVVPVMIAVILGLSSAYQTVGHLDLRALAAKIVEKPKQETLEPTPFPESQFSRPVEAG